MRGHRRLKAHNLHFAKLKDLENYEDFSERIRKTLYYAKLPSADRPSFPVTDILVDKFGEFCKKDSFDQLSLYEASFICYNACVTPCSVILAFVYLERLRAQNPEYLTSVSPSQIFLVSLMVASKFLYDDGEDDEVYNDEWAASAAMLLSDLNEAELNFLTAIDWNLFVNVDSFAEGLLDLEAMVAKRQGLSQGFFVYSDLVSLSSSSSLSPVLSSFTHLIGSVFAFCIVGYTATILIVVGGVVLAHRCSLLSTGLVFPYLSSSQQYARTNVSTPSVSLNSDHTLNNDILTQELPSNIGGIFDEEDADHGLTSSISSKFTSLRTLTTAFLLASSSFNEIPSENPSPSNVMNCRLGHLGIALPPSDLTFSDALVDRAPCEWAQSCYLGSSKRRKRTWRKPPVVSVKDGFYLNSSSQSLDFLSHDDNRNKDLSSRLTASAATLFESDNLSPINSASRTFHTHSRGLHENVPNSILNEQSYSLKSIIHPSRVLQYVNLTDSSSYSLGTTHWPCTSVNLFSRSSMNPLEREPLVEHVNLVCVT